MWNRRKDEDSRPSLAPPSAAETAKEGIPLSTMPARTSDFELTRGSATIGKSVTVKGQIYSKEDLVVDGEIDGAIELLENRLTVGPNGKLNAGVKAREIVVLGTIVGDVEALDKIDIRKDAKLVGDIKTSRIIIEDGAYFKGSIDIVKHDQPKPAPSKPQVPISAPAATPAPVASQPAATLPGQGQGRNPR